MCHYWNINTGIDQETFLENNEDLFCEKIDPNALCNERLLFAENDYSNYL